MKNRLLHIYCGDGKGKTTCGMGLCTRAAGYGYRVLIYQFMKDNSTSERKVLLLSPNVTFVPGQDKIKFSFLMTPEEKAEQKRYYEEQFQKVTEKAVQEEYDVLFLDELVYTIGSKLFDEQLLLDFLDQQLYLQSGNRQYLQQHRYHLLLLLLLLLYLNL